MPEVLHVISFDVPYPADYGGVIDVFWRIKSLQEAGCQIILHCFEYGREKSSELNEICKQVHYYRRKMSPVQQFSFLPFIVKSRANPKLLQNLLADSHPIWFEGLHTCSYIDHPLLASRMKFVRTHNIEHEYYKGLASAESNWLKRLYFKLESIRLKAFEKILQKANAIFCISLADHSYYLQANYPAHYLPAYVPERPSGERKALENFALYHGNLEVAENQAAVRFLLEVFEPLNLNLIVAGKNPSKQLREAIKSSTQASLRINPSEEEMEDLIAKARMICLPTFQNTGIKLKLIRSLLLGNQVLVNSEMIHGTGLEEFVKVADKQDAWRKLVQAGFKQNLDRANLEKRQMAMREKFSNSANTKRLQEWLAEAR